MALKRKRGSSAVQLNSTITTDSEQGEKKVTETWIGPYSSLVSKQASVQGKKYTTTSLSPTEAGDGTLTITTTSTIQKEGGGSGDGTTIEVVWAELRLPVESHPFFKDLEDKDIEEVKKAADNRSGSSLTGTKLKLYKKLLKGVTSYSIGAPVVRRTSNKPANLSAGNAWVKSDPPIPVAGGWKFLKTADEIRRSGSNVSRVEEWTGAEEWDTDLYT